MGVLPHSSPTALNGHKTSGSSETSRLAAREEASSFRKPGPGRRSVSKDSCLHKRNRGDPMCRLFLWPFEAQAIRRKSEAFMVGVFCPTAVHHKPGPLLNEKLPNWLTKSKAFKKPAEAQETPRRTQRNSLRTSPSELCDFLRAWAVKCSRGVSSEIRKRKHRHGVSDCSERLSRGPSTMSSTTLSMADQCGPGHRYISDGLSSVYKTNILNKRKTTRAAWVIVAGFEIRFRFELLPAIRQESTPNATFLLLFFTFLPRWKAIPFANVIS